MRKEMQGRPKKLSDRVIHCDCKINQWYCVACSYGHNNLIIAGGESYCEKCYPGDMSLLPVYNQNREVVK